MYCPNTDFPNFNIDQTFNNLMFVAMAQIAQMNWCWHILQEKEEQEEQKEEEEGEELYNFAG